LVLILAGRAEVCGENAEVYAVHHTIEIGVAVQRLFDLDFTGRRNPLCPHPFIFPPIAANFTTVFDYTKQIPPVI